MSRGGRPPNPHRVFQRSKAMSDEQIKEVTDQDFESEVLQADKPVVVDMWAPWCGPCRFVTPVIEELAGENEGKAKVCKLNVDDNPETAQNYGITAIPSVILFQNGEEKDRLVGVQKKESYQQAIDNLIDQSE